MSGILTAARFGFAALSGVDALVDATAQYAVKLALRSRAADDEAAQAIVDAARADAPQLTGTLVNGITWRRDGDASVVEASALRSSGGETWDYAVFQEHGTAREMAEPFFYGNADEVLEGRGERLDAAAGAAAADAGW